MKEIARPDVGNLATTVKASLLHTSENCKGNTSRKGASSTGRLQGFVGKGMPCRSRAFISTTAFPYAKVLQCWKQMLLTV